MSNDKQIVTFCDGDQGFRPTERAPDLKMSFRPTERAPDIKMIVWNCDNAFDPSHEESEPVANYTVNEIFLF